MDRTPVKSSNVASIGFDPAQRVMEIEFKSGGVYQHAEVPKEAFDALMASSSKGGHYAAHFRGKFAHQKVS